MNFSQAILILSLVFLFQSCDAGLNPDNSELSSGPGFRGTITFIGEWPRDVKLTYVVLFKDPLISPIDFNAINLKYVSELIPVGSSKFEFSSNESLFGNVVPGEYAYLAVAQSSSETLVLTRSAWKVAGIYNSESNSSAGAITVPSGRILDGINIVCDFNNPPNQPPGE